MKPLRKIVIVGGGASGWIAAAMLSQHLDKQRCSITLVESNDFKTMGIGESTVPPFVGLIRQLGINEQDFVRKTHATYKLGIKFVDWQQRNQNYFHPFGSIGKSIDTHDFYQCWLKARSHGDTSALQDFSPCNVMAESGRFFFPQKARNTPIGGANYALHVDAAEVASYLRNYSEARGVIRIEGAVQQVVQSQQQFIERIILQNGDSIDGDFFIDCTGFKALLIEKTLGSGFEDWAHYLPCDRAIALKTQSRGTTLPYTTATARQAGWTWNIPLQHRVGHGYVYASRFSSDDEARSRLLRSMSAPIIDEPRFIPFQTGRRREAWKLNCLSLGLAAGFVEPLESTAIHLIARGMDFFLRYFPDRDCDPYLVKEYNRRMAADYEEVRDFIVLHYAATRRDDTEFWRWCKNIVLPDSLQERIALFKGHGALRDGVDELFRASSWQSVFEGMGIRPAKYCPRVDNINPQQLTNALNVARYAIRGMVKNLPAHDDFLHE